VPEFITYTVESGDTLIAIAQEFDQTSETILAANADTLASPHDLSIGQQLRVPVQSAPADGPVAEAPPAEGEPVPAVAAEGEAPAATVPVEGPELSDEVAKALGLPTADVAALQSGPVVGAAGGAAAEAAAGGHAPAAAPVESERSSAVAFPAPLTVVPPDGATVSGDSPILRWSSSGVLPPGTHYVVTLAEAGVEGAKPRVLWVMTNATSIRLPGDARPALGTSKDFLWSVSVRERTGRLVGADEGELRSRPSMTRRFTWTP
jgi:hypothetical protein